MFITGKKAEELGVVYLLQLRKQRSQAWSITG